MRCWETLAYFHTKIFTAHRLSSQAGQVTTSKVGQHTNQSAQPASCETSSYSEMESASENSSSVTRPTKRKRGQTSAILYWTPEQVKVVYHCILSVITSAPLYMQDTALPSAVAKYKSSGWATVAGYVGNGATSEQCRHRWQCYLAPIEQGLRNDGNW